MEPSTRPASGFTPARALRCIGIGVAGAELIYLVWWTGIDLGLIDKEALSPPALGGEPISSLAGLGLGMAWAAAVGLLAGLVAVASASLAGWPARLEQQPADQDLARSLVVRNQTR